MAAARVLYVGDDICHRIPVMESTGIFVLRSDCSIDGVRSAFKKGNKFSAVTFHNDLVAPARAVVSAARELYRAPLILFRNLSIDCDEKAFDLVITVPTPPDVWAKSLAQAIRESRKIHARSRQLRADCERVRDASQTLREMSARNRVSPVDYQALFRSLRDEADE